MTNVYLLEVCEPSWGSVHGLTYLTSPVFIGDSVQACVDKLPEFGGYTGAPGMFFRVMEFKVNQHAEDDQTIRLFESNGNEIKPFWNWTKIMTEEIIRDIVQSELGERT